MNDHRVELLKLIRRTPLHPQWLLGSRNVPNALARATGMVLDIGSADRWLQKHLPCAELYIGLDYPDTVNTMYGTRPDIFADAACLPIANDSIDTVACLEVIEHVQHPASLVSEIARVLRPGGRVWISVPFLYPVHDAPHDFRRYTEYGLRQLFADSGLEIGRINACGHSIRNAGLLMSLALSGPLRDGGIRAALLALPAMLMVAVVNVSVWTLSLLWPSWTAMPVVYEVEAIKP